MNDAPAKEPLYREILRDIYPQTLADLQSSSRLKVFLSGGRGMGKTFLLQELAEFRSRETGVESRIIDGRNWPAALEELARSHAVLGRWRATRAGSDVKGDNRLGDLLVDDLDRLIDSAGAQEPQVFEELMTHLLDLISSLPENGKLCAFTSLFHANRMAELLEMLDSRPGLDRKTSLAIRAFSTLIQMYDNMPINPWSRGWEKKIGVCVKARLPRLSSAGQELCRNLLTKLTGGHPALLVPALSELVALAATRDLSSTSSAELEIVIEDAAHEKGIGVLRRALSSLRDAEREEWRSAYEDLRQLALGNIPAPPLLSREILVGEGLLYKEESSLRYVIPGEILRGELLREPAGPLRMEIEPDPQAPDKHGFLKVWDRFRERRIPLSGGAWSVLKTIFDEPARTISLDELCERTHLTTENAVRSAIQRLIGDARASGVENILDNLYGKGYRKGESPSWSNLT
jgi:hypothetical protein